MFDKSFIAEHGTRESVNDMLQESFRVKDTERGETRVLSTPHLTARAHFASPAVRQRQLMVLTVEVSLVDGIHIIGRPLPEGYIPVELTLDGGEYLLLDRVDYPQPEQMELLALGERLPVYSGRIEVKAHCIGIRKGGEEEVFQVIPKLRYQACDDCECYLPETISFPLSLRFLPHVR